MKCLWGLHAPVIQSYKKAEIWSMWWNVLTFFRLVKSFLSLCFSDSWEENNWAEKHALLSPSAGHRGAVIWFTVILPHHHRAAHHHRDPAGTRTHTYLYEQCTCIPHYHRAAHTQTLDSQHFGEFMMLYCWFKFILYDLFKIIWL